jgi:hypothetical protein
MKIEQQVCSLELAKRLKELGVKQESICAYYRRHKNAPYVLEAGGMMDADDKDGWISAFTVAELGEMLPMAILYKYVLDQLKTETGYRLVYRDENDIECATFASTEADARAKMLIYLLENKLLTLP